MTTSIFTIFIISSSICFFTCCSEYIPPGPLYRCPKEKLLLHPCSCDIESDVGIHFSCNNTNLASMSVALNNLATFELPIEVLTIKRCHFARLFGSLLYRLRIRILKIEDTPIETIDQYSFLGVNNTLNELNLINTSLSEFPTGAFKILGNLTILHIDGHKMKELPKDAFSASGMAGKLLKLHIVNGDLVTPLVESLQPLRKLKTLDLHGNKLKDLKRNQFKGLRDVESLDISYNSIHKLDGTHLGDLTKMGWLNVSHNEIKEITRGAFARNTVLKVLNMSFNQIKKLDTNSFKGMRFLRRLYLSDNLIGNVARGTFQSLQRIGTIDLARNFIQKIDYQMFYQLNFIEILDVSENNVTEIQKQAFKDLFLTTIILKKNQIEKIESGAFENCANMTKLDLSYNKLESLPKQTFDDTTYATELQFTHNFFKELDQIPLHNMSGLKILNVSYNALTTIPRKTFPKLYELHTIDLSHNNISDIFNSVFQTLFSLRYLNLSYNSMTSIKPSTFGPLPTLLELDLSYNDMETMAKSALTRLASTRKLIVRGNKLKTLFILPISTSHLDLSYNEFEELPPEQWPSMNALLYLDLSHNKLVDNLDDNSFANLLTLQTLVLDYNGLTKPPWNSISKLSSLQYLHLKGNNLTRLERNAFGKLPVVFELNLAENNIYNISVRAFEGLLQVQVMNLTRNNLTVIPNEAFKGLVSLKILDMSHNRITKLDNRTNSIFEECLSLEKLILNHNKINFITRKSFPSNPYVPYKLSEIDLSYNHIPVLTYDFTFGTNKLEKLNLSHNAIGDIRKGVIGNMTRLQSFDISFNQLTDLTSDMEVFILPRSLSKLYMSHNELSDLPWKHLNNVTQLDVLDVSYNKFDTFGVELTAMVLKGIEIHFEGNPLYCDCFLRPLVRYFSTKLHLEQYYSVVKCLLPQYLSNISLSSLSEERLNCAKNVNTSRLLDDKDGEYDVMTDLRFRDLTLKKGTLKLKWRVMKNTDIADTYVFIRDAKSSSQSVIYQTTLPYFKRSLEMSKANLSMENVVVDSEYQVCIISKDSQDNVGKFYQKQCRNLNGISRGSRDVFYVNSLLLVCCVIYNIIY